MTFIMICGGPASGKTKTLEAIKEALDGNTTYAVIDHTMKQSNVAVTLYRWAAEKNVDVMLVDSFGNNVWTRKELLDVLSSLVPGDSKITKVAIYLDRSNGFMYSHNKDAEHEALPDAQMRNLLRIVQQPIHQEGFDVIYRVKFNDEVNCHDLFKTIERKTSVHIGPSTEVEGPVEVNPAETEAAESTDSE